MNYNVVNKLGEVVKEIELNEKVSIPLSEQGANEILRINAVISDKNTKIINGKIIVKGHFQFF